MKKLGILFVVFIFLFATGCKSNKTKVVTSLDNFNNVLTSENFSVNDKSSGYENISYINGAMQAISGTIIMEMFEYTDVESAKKVHSEHVENFNLLKSTGAHEIKDEGQNYYKYVLISNGYFMVSVQVDNTVIFCKTFLDYKDLVDGIYNKLGY